jgi:hypothetical protein
MSMKGPVFPVAFERLAMAEDLARLGREGAEMLAALGREIDRLGGLPRERLSDRAPAAERINGLSAALRAPEIAYSSQIMPCATPIYGAGS